MPAAGLPRRLGDPPGERCPGDGVGEPRQGRGLGGPGAEQAPDEGLVEGVHDPEGFVEPFDGLGEQVRSHQATAPVGGNHCISGSGAVPGASSR